MKKMRCFKWERRVVREVGPRIRGPEAVANLAQAILEPEWQEVMLAFLLNTQHWVVGWTEVTRGTTSASLVDPMLVFRPALLEAANNVVVVHNHPSGDPAPSREDRIVAKHLAKAGDVIGIRMLDFIVVGSEGRWESIRPE
jgi:DNA repair protein RadC